MSNAPHLATDPAQDTTPSAELNALAVIYRRAIERHEEKKNAAGCDQHRDGDDTKERSVLPAVRELISNNPDAARYGAETIAALLYARRFFSYRPAAFDVEVALEALQVEGEVMP